MFVDPALGARGASEVLQEDRLSDAAKAGQHLASCLPALSQPLDRDLEGAAFSLASDECMRSGAGTGRVWVRDGIDVERVSRCEMISKNLYTLCCDDTFDCRSERDKRRRRGLASGATTREDAPPTR